MANSMAISKVTVATRATATKAMAINMDMVMSSKAMDMASNKVMGTASHKVMAMAETRAMDNMRAMVATKATAMRGMVATKAMAVSLIRVTANKATVPNRDTAINKAVTATASSKVTQGALTELTTDLTSH